MRTDGHIDMTELIVAFRIFFFERALKIVQECLQAQHFFLRCEETCASLDRTD